MDILVEPLDKTHRRADFDCGVHELNEFLKRYARQNQKNSISKTYVAVSEMDAQKNDKEVLGFYTLSSGHVDYDALPKQIKHPKYPVSIARLARLATDLKHQGKGVGGYLLYDALKKISAASQIIGIFSVVVDAKDTEAKKFYARYGFLQLEEKELTLFLPVDTINKLFEEN